GGAASVGTGPGGTAGTEESGGASPGLCGKGCKGKLGAGAEGSVTKEGTAGGGGGGGLFGGGGGETNGEAESGGGGGGGGSSLQPPGGRTVVPALAAAPEVQITYTPLVPLLQKVSLPHETPSNVFMLLRPIVGAHRSITLVLGLPGGGTVKAAASALHEVLVKKHGKGVRRKLRFTFGTARATATTGALELTIKPSAAGRKALAAHKILAVSIAVTFTPIGGTAATKRVTVRLPRR
ncbi:MAG TPA: hypothetical protein VF927_06950, partial [Solirubrobacteraceae bacterium]